MSNNKYEVLRTIIEETFIDKDAARVMILIDSLLDEVYHEGAGDSEDTGEILHVSKETSDLIYSLELDDEQMIELVDAIWEEKEQSWCEGYEAAVEGEEKVSPIQ
ncbi:hypothetical protein EBT16_10430 [bacterium]|nr:hypothetical protein [bacterium]